jgi:hypothetical protein
MSRLTGTLPGMENMSSGDLLCLGVVTVLVVGAVLIAWAKAFAARKTGRWPDDRD